MYVERVLQKETLRPEVETADRTIWLSRIFFSVYARGCCGSRRGIAVERYKLDGRRVRW